MITRPSRRALLKGLVGSAATLFAGGAYAFWAEPAYRLAVTRYAPRLPGWPEGFRLSIAALADIHVGEPHVPLGRLDAIVARTNALRPDLIVLLGDYAASHSFVSRAVPTEAIAASLRQLRAPLGVFSILGNHDWWDDADVQRLGRGYPLVGRELSRAGIPVLHNEVVRLAKGEQPFWLLGLGDQIAFPGRRNPGVDDLPGTLAQAADGAPAILLAHEPDIFPRVPARVALTLSGHTHGGQVRLLGYSPVVPSKFGNRYAYGHVIEGSRNLIVSGGLGTSIMPVRFGVPPEIVLIELGTDGA